MARDLNPTQEPLKELEPVAAENVNRHLSMAQVMHPHDYVPWDEGRNFAAMGGVDWDPEQSKLSEVAKAAMITNLLTEDNLPSYHREIAENFSRDGAWVTWVGRCRLPRKTATASRCATTWSSPAVSTRSPSSVRLRIEHMTVGFGPTDDERETSFHWVLQLGRLCDVPGARHPGQPPQYRARPATTRSPTACSSESRPTRICT